MATIVVDRSSVGVGGDCRTVLQNAATNNPNDTLRLTSSVEATWNISGRADPNGTGGSASVLGGAGPGAVGAVDFNNNILLLDPGVIVQEMASSPITELWQPLLRWAGKTGVGITFGAGSKIRGQRAAHIISDPDHLSEFMACARFTSCTGVTINGTNEVHFEEAYGDGLWFSSGGYLCLGPFTLSNSAVVVNNILSSNNYRNGITIEDMNGGVFNNCYGTGNIGTQPQCFMDIETDVGTELQDGLPGGRPDRLVVDVSGGYSEGRSRGIAVIIANILSTPISINIRNHSSLRSLVAGDDPWGFSFFINAANTGVVNAYNLQSKNIKDAGLRLEWRLDSNVQLNFIRCILDLCANTSNKPLDFAFTGSPTGVGIRFVDCLVKESQDRKIVAVTSAGGAATNVTGNITIQRSVWPGTSSADALLPNLTYPRSVSPNAGRMILRKA